LIQLRSNEGAESRKTFSSARIPQIGTFEKVVRLWFTDTSNVTAVAQSTRELETTDKVAFFEPANLQLARAYFKSGQIDEARQIAKRLDAAKNLEIRRDALKLQVQMAISRHRRTEAENLYRRFLVTFPTSDKEFQTLITMNATFKTGYGVLDVLETPKNQLEFIRGLYSRKSYYDYRVMAEEYLRRHPSTSDAAELITGIGVGRFETGDYTLSMEKMTEVLKRFPKSKQAATAQYYLGRGLHRTKKYEEAKIAYLEYLRKYDSEEYSPAVYYYLYWICQELGVSDQYEPYLRSFKAKYSNTLFYDKLMWEFGWNAYLKQDFPTAFDILNKTDWKFDPDVTAKVMFWLAKVATQIDPLQGDKWFRKVVQEHPFTYYGYRVATQLFPDQVAALSQRFNPTGVQIDPLYRTMLEAGLGDMAVADLDYRINRLKDRNSKTVVTMAYVYSGMLQNHRAINLLTSLGFAINAKEPKISQEIAQLLYPRPYWGVIQSYSKEFDVDPYFALALMREESLFNPGARSRTGAVGLMQIMPSTGQGIAKGLKADWNGADTLLVPETNIRFGIYYIASLKKRFNNNPILMLSGYNAGPNATRKWMDKHESDDMDVFVANIPYSETHYYVTRVLKSYWIYRLLYDPEFNEKKYPIRK
jgi:soluble lytic murein transglycosylase-like protein/outer membrane protein assembly factor BamD (BamD/ComL family)